MNALLIKNLIYYFRDARRKGKKGKLKRNSSSSFDGDIPSKKKYVKNDSLKRDKTELKKTAIKKDEAPLKKHTVTKKKVLNKVSQKSLSPGKKSGGTPPITSKNPIKPHPVSKHSKTSPRRDKNRSVSPPSMKDRDKDRDRGGGKDREKDKERDKDRDKEKDRNRARSRSLRKARSRSLRRHGSHPKDPRRKDSSERGRPISPKKQVKRDVSSHRKRSPSRDRDRGRDHKDRSLERRKDKHDDKDRHDRNKERLDRGRERIKDNKRDDSKRNRGRDRGLGRGGTDKGLEKPNKPMERLLPRPEERLAALAAISNRTLESDKASTNSKDRQDTSERGGRKQERLDRERSSKRGERIDSIEREQGDYNINMERQYEHGHTIEHYNRGDDRYDDGPRDDDRSPGYVQNRDRHYDPGYDMPGSQRGYQEDEERIYNEHRAEHRNVDGG